jgi:hypothetical protein
MKKSKDIFLIDMDNHAEPHPPPASKGRLMFEMFCNLFIKSYKLLLRWKGCFYKVLAVRSPAKDLYRFECLNLKPTKSLFS